MIFVFGGAFISGTRDAESYRPFFEYMRANKGTPSFRSTTGSA